MNIKKIIIALGITVIIGIVCFVIYVLSLASMWQLHSPDERPFFKTTTPVMLKNLKVPEGSKVIYEKRFFWKKEEQEHLLNEEHISEIVFTKQAIHWGGVPIRSINKFYNSAMKGYTVNPDFSQLNDARKSRFAQLWASCHDELGVTIKNTDDWSFDRSNIVDVESCGVNHQRYFEEDQKQQDFLDDLYQELLQVQYGQ